MLLKFTIPLLIGLLFIQLLWISTNKHHFTQVLIDVKNRNKSKTFLFIFLILVLQILTGILIPFPTYHYGMYFILGGLAIYEFGIALAVWSKLTLQDNWGSPGEHNTQYQKELVTNGPFAYSRNPLYIGLLLITFGFGITVQSFLALLFIPLYFYFLTIIRKEETLLEQHFGKEYKEYRKKVSRFL